MEQLIKDIKKRLKNLNNQTDSEENLKINFTRWLLGELGYNVDDFDYEYRLCRRGKERHADIYVPVKDSALFIETKRYSKDLDEEDVLQLVEYLNMNSLLWGILTNGRQYYLINNAINIHNGPTLNKTNMSKVVLHIDIGIGDQRPRNEKYLKYFSKENIFDNMTTNFYRDIAQFLALRSFKNEESKNKYVNALYNFFDFHSRKKHKYNISNRDATLALEEITENDVIDFLSEERPNGRPSKGGVPETQCFYIKSMFDILQDAKYIRDNKMKNLIERARKEFSTEDSKLIDLESVLTNDNISIILKWIDAKKTPIQLIIFILAAYYGFDRSAIVEFCKSPWEIIDFKKHSFEFKGKRYLMVTKLEVALLKMKQLYKEKKIKLNYICILTHGGKYRPANVNTINSFFKEGVHQFKEGNVNWNEFNLQNIRASLIINLFKAGCSLEEISYLTGVPISSIMRPDVISDEMIKKSGEKSWKSGIKSGQIKHPFNSLFNT